MIDPLRPAAAVPRTSARSVPRTLGRSVPSRLALCVPPALVVPLTLALALILTLPTPALAEAPATPAEAPATHAEALSTPSEALSTHAAGSAPVPDTLVVRITPERLDLSHGAQGRLELQVESPAGASLAGRTVIWNVQNPQVATVGPTGQVQARSAGRTLITALVDGALATAVVEVAPPPAARLAVSLPAGTLVQGTGAPLGVEAWSDDGSPLDPADLRFSSSDPEVVRVDEGGRVHALAPGTARLEARSGQVAAGVEVQVIPDPGLTFELSPPPASVRTGDVVRFRLEGRLPGAGQPPEVFPVWGVDGPGAAIEAEGAEGVFVAQETGRYRVTAALGDAASRSVLVDVEPRDHDAVLVRMGRGILDGHHSGDMWVFEGPDGRDYVYIGTFQHDWLKVFDVTEPARPILTDSVWMDARRINDVKVHESGRLVVATREGASDRRNGIVVLDTSDPAHPRVLSEYTETLTGGVHNVWIEGDLVYACHNGTSDLHIIDISDPANPREVGRWGLDREQKTLHDAIVQDGYAYLSYWDDGMVMLDVGAGSHGGTPTEPAFVSRFSYPQGHTHTAWRDGRYLFVGDEIFPMDWDPTRPIEARGYIHVLDMTDPEAPVEVARYEVPEAGAHNVWVDDDLLYVGYYQAGLRVVDVSGELRGDLYRQGRELAVLKTTDEHTMVPNWPMTWGAQPFKGHIFSSDLNSGLWVTRLELTRPVVF